MNRISSITGAAAIAAGLSVAVPAGVSLAASAAPAARMATTSAHGLPNIVITMTGKKITVGGRLQSGGVRIVSKVSHEPQGQPVLVRLDPGVTVPQFLAALPKIAADQNNIAGIGAIVFSPQANRGTTSAQANLKPGSYIALGPAADHLYHQRRQLAGQPAQAAGHHRLDRIRLPGSRPAT